MDPASKFKEEVKANISALNADGPLKAMTLSWMERSNAHRYTYNFSWLGRPVIQYPQDIIAMQEVIFSVKPDLIIETGIAHGGSLVFSASMLALLEYCDAMEKGESIDPRNPSRRVLGVDIDIRPHNRALIEAHPMGNRIDMIQGSSVAPDVVARVRDKAIECERVLVCLDSNHTHEHVLQELEAYAPLVGVGSYCVVFDTAIEDMPEGMFRGRGWGKGSNPKTAVKEYLRRLRAEGRNAADGPPLHFEIDKIIEGKLLITVAPDGYLKRTE